MKKFDLINRFLLFLKNIKPCKYLNLNSPFLNGSTNVMFLIHLNIRSLQKNFDNLCEFLSQLSSKPHAIAISKTKIKDTPLVNISIPGYTFLHKNSMTKAGGVGMYISDSFQFKELQFNFSFSGCESLWFRLTCPNSKIDYVVSTVYRHPSTNTTEFYDYLSKIFIELNMNQKY